MRWFLNAKSACLALIVTGCGVINGCSDSPPDSPADAAPDAARPDAKAPDVSSPDALLPDVTFDRSPDVTSPDVKPDGDGGGLTDKVLSDSDAPTCSEQPLTTTLARFIVTKHWPDGGIANDGSICDRKNGVYEYSPGENTLWEKRCNGTVLVGRTVALTNAGVSEINAALLALRTTCGKTCVTDTYLHSMQILDERGCAQRHFNDNHLTSCNGTGGRPYDPPYVDEVAMRSFWTLLENRVKAACDDRDAGSFEAGAGPGICSVGPGIDAGPPPFCGDGGLPDAQPPPDAEPPPDAPNGDAARARLTRVLAPSPSNPTRAHRAPATPVCRRRGSLRASAADSVARALFARLPGPDRRRP